MQPSALYRRSVVIPLNDDAEADFQSWDVSPSTQAHHIEIGDSLFESLWSSDLFKLINRHCNSVVDDHEETIIEATRLQGVVRAIETIESRQEVRGAVSEFLKELHQLTQTAIREKRPLIFIL